MTGSPIPKVGLAPFLVFYSIFQKKNATHWQSIYVSGFFAILNGVQLNIFVSSQWPFLRSVRHLILSLQSPFQLDSRFPESSLGYIISMFSIAQFIASPLFGYWSDRTNAVSLTIYQNCQAHYEVSGSEAIELFGKSRFGTSGKNYAKVTVG